MTTPHKKVVKSKLVLFDFDGTLVDSMRIGNILLWKEVNNRLKNKIPFATFQGRIQKVQEVIFSSDHDMSAGSILVLTWAYILARQFGLNRFSSLKLMLKTTLLTLKAYNPNNLFPDVRISISRLKTANFLVGIFTMAPRRFVQLTFGHQIKEFDVIITRNEIKQLKPHPSGIIFALKRLGVRSEDCFVIGDLPLDILAAHRAKVVSVGITTGFASRSVLEKFRPCAVFNNLEEVTEYIINLPTAPGVCID